MNRAQMIYALEETIEAVKDSRAKEKTPVLIAPLVTDLTPEQKADDEYESLGYFISHNPLEKYRHKLVTLASTQDLVNKREGESVVLGGLMTNLKSIMTKAKKEMAFFDLEDLHGRVEVVAFSYLYAKNKNKFAKNKPVEIRGKVESQVRDINGEEFVTTKIILQSVSELEEGKRIEKVTIYPKDGDDFNKIYDIIISNPGNIPVEIDYNEAVLKTDYKILSEKSVLEELESSCLTRRNYGN